MIKIYKYGEVSNDEIFARDNIAPDVEGVVAEIIANVIKNKDKALFEYCEKFDKATLTSLEVNVWQDGRTNKFLLSGLSTSACFTLHLPSIASERSNIALFSTPVKTSKLLRPKSPSTTATLNPLLASFKPKFAVKVVFPTPPLPDVITYLLAITKL